MDLHPKSAVDIPKNLWFIPAAPGKQIRIYI